MRRAGYALTVAAVLAAALAGCESGEYGGGGEDTAAAPSAAAPSRTVLTTAKTDLGEVVVDGQGMTVYYYTPDDPGSGKSACTGDCLAAWPPVHADGDDPKTQGVTGDVATITGNDGKPQVTLDGHPLYLYAGDGKPGDVKGQGIGEIWWVVAPDGTEVTDMPMTGGY